MNSIPKLTPEKQHAAIENAFDGIAILDENGTYYYMNKAHAMLFGYDSAEELIGKSWKHIYSSEYADKIEKDIFPVLMSTGNWSGETIGKDKLGQPVLQYISLTLLPDRGLICVCQDNSKTINANRLQYLMRNLGKGILVEDEESRVVLVNAKFCEMFQIGISPEKMNGADCLEALDNALPLFAEPDQVKEDIIGLVTDKNPVIGDEVTMADERILERDYIPIIIGNVFKGQLWSYTDVTQSKKLQKSLEETKNRAIASERAKSVFLSTVSHEIRTPMHAIMGFAEQLSLTALNEQQKYFINNIQDAAAGLLVIINDILDMTKIEAGKLNIENGLLNLRDVVKSVENILRPKAEEKGLILETSFDELINGRLNGDPTRIRQILMNILSNAIKFTEKGKVQLKLQLQETKGLYQKVSITCLDTGIGISEDVIRFIFNEFYQEYVGGYNGMEGTGLGLSITKKLIHLMNGNIVVTSEKGKWTKVYIEIPLHIDESIQLEVEPPEADLSKEMLEKRILIVEDNKLNRNLFVIMLQNMGCLVTEAENGQEAIDILQTHSFDLVLMDIQMPVMDGLTALSKILDGPNSHTPVIALTATAFKSEVNNLLSQGFADCITKPIDQKNLNLRLCQFFKNHKLEDSHLMAMKERIKARIEDMAGNNQSKAAKLMQYLAEEVKLAIKEWKLALITMDWSSARKILHREKMMIQAVGITGLDTIIEDFENENAGKTDHEMHMMLSRLIELFTEIDSMFSS
jgi:PAS domain S-box-containing protein